LAAAVQARALQATLSAARRGLDSTAAHLDALASREVELLEANARATRERMTAGQEAAEREARLEEQIRHERAARAELEEQVKHITEQVKHLTQQTAVLAARENEIEQLRTSLEMRVDERNQSRADNHRQFQHAPMPMFRCTKHGVLTEANRMLRMLLGRRSAEELNGADLAALIFESPNDLSWLIERCLRAGGKESTETTWRRNDGSRLLVRLSARATSADLIECGVEDLTPVRVLNDRLSEAHRMEAVGRLATEVAVTCGTLLRGVHESAQQWLTDGSRAVSRHGGEMLLEELARAAALIRQLAEYGDQESRSPGVVEVRTVVRDVAPVLKRVAGDGVEVQLPSASAPLNIDAGAERVKRLLVNLAASARERMPYGGRLKIELGTVVVDRYFAAKHPNVRLGLHALVTLTESRRTTRTDGLLQLNENEAGSRPRGAAIQTRVDLGTAQELVAECGGHLWMTVDPAGDMVVKIRLPLVTSYGEPPRRALAPLRRVPTLAHWFQH
jgi:PAS domain-containing protein